MESLDKHLKNIEISQAKLIQCQINKIHANLQQLLHYNFAQTKLTTTAYHLVQSNNNNSSSQYMPKLQL